eukprot:gnl/TRDRNA2_/TRDRNA2_181574_c0_seq1.p1 gnl/TRDRNA2_/TRDRNA2_181574_c0~~gnl/TRDRNA2_/TRDRNA2_181574_c0_seq1.p1  ORF type:complete len:955 (+),score=274.35 gnl/TRDRNA2_/TRDRNA2_181574_c0_seq1:61-2925(+)
MAPKKAAAAKPAAAKPKAKASSGPSAGPSADPIHTPVDYSKFTSIPDPDEEAALTTTGSTLATAGAADMDENEAHEMMLAQAYAAEIYTEDDGQVDRIKDLKIKMAMDAYEKRRPKDRLMHHYWVKDAGDPDACGEYHPTGDERNGAPIYKNAKGLVLSREKQPTGEEADEEATGWVIGSMEERRPLYGVMSDDLSVPTLGWQAFTSPEPVPTIRYYTHESAAKVFKDRGNRAFQKKEYTEAEKAYTMAIECRLDPMQLAEPCAMILSNRAEVRLRLGKFDEAAEDAEGAARHLRSVTSTEEATQLLKQKTIVRRAKALQGAKKFTEAHRILKEGKPLFPQNLELERMLEESELALAASGGKSSKVQGKAAEPLLKYVGSAVDTLQREVARLGDGAGDYALPDTVATTLKKLEYVFTKAKSLDDDTLSSLQTVLRANGGMRSLLEIVKAQWAANLDGKIADTYKLSGLASVCVVVSFACDGCPENLRYAATEAQGFVAALGGCNRKVEADVCERLIALVAMLWEQCKPLMLDSTLPNSMAFERAASFLSKTILAELTDDAAGPDSPTLSAEVKGQALSMLKEWLAYGGRLEKRTLRGIVPNLSGSDGAGFFSSSDSDVKALGELVLTKAVDDPSLLTTRDVRNLLLAVQLLIYVGPLADAKDKDVATVTYEEYSPNAVMRYVDLGEWDTKEDGKLAACVLTAVAKALEYRLVYKNRELEKDDFEVAFVAGNGYYLAVPLVQAPPAFAEPALCMLAAMAQVNMENTNTIVTLQCISALLGFPSPAKKPTATYVEKTMKTSPGGRLYMAKVLSMCIEHEEVMDLLKGVGEASVTKMAKLLMDVRNDGTGNLEGFHDMMRVFYMISQTKPGALCRTVPVDMMNMLVYQSKEGSGETMPAYCAKTVISVLMKDRECEKQLLPIIQRAEDQAADRFATGADLEEIGLQQSLTSPMGRID